MVSRKVAKIFRKVRSVLLKVLNFRNLNETQYEYFILKSSLNLLEINLL